MPPKKFLRREKSHNATIIFGEKAIEAFTDGEAKLEFLLHIGALKSYSFHTEAEKNSFLFGVDEALGQTGVHVLEV